MTLENVSDIYPLSPAQSGMLFHSIAEPEQGAYVNRICIQLEGPLEPDLFAKAFQSCFSRHDALKTCFVWDGVDEPLQVIREQVDFPFVVHNWIKLDEEAVSQRQKSLINDLGNLPFELEHAPLVEAHLCRLNPNSNLLILKYHHLILDGWSVHSLVHELLGFYADPNSPREPASPFKNYIAWLKGQDHENALRFWAEELVGFQSPNQICDQPNQTNQLDRSTPDANDQTKEPGFAQRSLCCDAELADRLKQLARSSRVTLNTVFQAAWSLTISRFSGGDEDVVFGTTVAGRPLELPGVEKTVGSFINTVPFRTQLDQTTNLRDWLSQIQSHQAQVREWDFASLAAIQKSAPTTSASDLFESILVFENYPTQNGSNSSALSATNFEHFERSNFPLALIVIPDETIEIIFIANERRISSDRTERLGAHLLMTLEHFVANKSATVDALASRLTEQDQKDLVSVGNGPNRKIPLPIQKQGVDELISQWAHETPAAVAVVQGDERLTYAELDQEADRIAAALVEAGCKPGQLVGLCLDRSLQMITGILGILKSGCAYVPMDAMYPPEHFRNVINDGQIQFVVTRNEHLNRLPVATDRTHVFLEDLESRSQPTKVPASELIAEPNERLAYVIYTSGSTGKPKGVAISHANLTHSTLARTDFYQADPSSFLLLSSFAFDSSVAGIFWTLMSGGKLVLPAQDEEKDPERLLEIIHEQSVSHLLCLPALYRVIAEASPAGEMRTLSTAIVAGEAVNNHVIETHAANLPNTKLFNEYGPSEGTVWATACQLTTKDLHLVPSIGKPISRTGVRILDPSGRPLPFGVSGEIHLLGDGLASGYVNAPELTNTKFFTIKDLDGTTQRVYRTGDIGYFRPDGNLVFQGRIDEQVKIRGFRIEIGEIESVIKEIDSVVDAVVIVEQVSQQASAHIVAFVETNVPTTTEQLLEVSQNRLAHFMVPDQWVILEQLPKLANGKVDRKAIRGLIPEEERPEKQPPTNETESKLVAIWSELLGQSDIGINDNFFSLGGDSIVSIQLISKARREGIFFKPVDVARFPTIAELAKISNQNDSPVTNAEVDGGPFPLTPIQEWFFANQFANPDHWNQSQLFEISSGYDREKLKLAVVETVRQHPMLHATFERQDGQWRQNTNNPEHVNVIEHAASECDSAELHEFYLQQQTTLSITEGPLFRVAMVKNESGPDQLLFVIHHLVVDVVSWSILAEQIEANYQALIADQPLPEMVPTTSYQTWAHHLGLKATQEDVVQQASHWETVLGPSPMNKATADRLATPKYTEATVDSAIKTFNVTLTQHLREQANEAYNTTFTELVLTSLSLSLCDFLDQPSVLIEIEKHGRDVLELDSSATVGWFTSAFPVRLTSATSDLDTTIKNVKETLRSVPHEGQDFGLLRFLNPEFRDRWSAYPAPSILFNFLGTSLPPRTEAVLNPIEGAKSTSRAGDNRQTHHLEFNAIIVGQELQIELRYNTILHSAAEAQQLLLKVGDNLERIVDHCMNHDRSYTPSDFSESGLSQTELDDLLSDFD